MKSMISLTGLMLFGVILGQPTNTITWTGAFDNDWHKPCNWSPAQVPTCSDSVVIPGGLSTYPVITGLAHCYSINIETTLGANITINTSGGAQLQVGKNGTCTGTSTVHSCPIYCSTIGGTRNDVGRSIIPTLDGGYIIGGHTYSFGQGSWDAYVVKTDPVGNLVWTKTVGGTGSDMGFSIIQTHDGGYAVAGYTYSSFNIAGRDVYVIKLDNTGNLLWAKNMGGTGHDEAKGIVETKDGGLIIAGYTDSYYSSSGDSNVYVIKLDSLGNLKWKKVIGGNGEDGALSIANTRDGGVVVAGYTDSYGQGVVDVYVVKLDSMGNLEWTRTIGGSITERGFSIVQTRDGGYAIAGHTLSYGQGGYDVYVVKLDSMGNLEWTRTIGGSGTEWAWSIVQTRDGGYAIAGYTNSYGQGGYDVYVVKLDSMGNLEWTRTIGGSDDDRGFSIIQTGDGGYIVIGYTKSFGLGWEDLYIVKLDSAGNLPSSCFNCVGGTGGIVSSGGVLGTGGSVLGSGGVSASGGVENTGGSQSRCP